MIKIGIVSDTHMPRMAKTIPKALIDGLHNVDLIIHAGDWQHIEIYDELKQLAPIEGVYGNVDDDQIKELFPAKKTLVLGNIKVGIVHGHGKGKTTEKRALESFSEDSVDIIIYGHSHIPVKKRINDIWVFNPGSPTDKRRQPQFSYGILEINENNFSLEHHFYEKKD